MNRALGPWIGRLRGGSGLVNVLWFRFIEVIPLALPYLDERESSRGALGKLP